MQQSHPTGATAPRVPTFYLTTRQPLRLGVILLATLAAVSVVSGIVWAMSHSSYAHLLPGSLGSGHSAGSSGDSADDDKDDDPNQIDTIVLGDPSEAPVPGKHGNHVSPVHPTIVIRLPREGKDIGMIPDSPAGHLLYDWLAAFNKPDAPALDNALPTVAPGLATAAQMDLRQQTGGFYLLSSKEIQPGILVFRLRDQTPAMTEVLGTLQTREDTIPATISSFSLRAVPAPLLDATPPASPR